MTTARRARPEPPTNAQRFAALISRGAHNESLVSALEDHIARLDGRARKLGPNDYFGQLSAELADELRRILQEHS